MKTTSRLFSDDGVFFAKGGHDVKMLGLPSKDKSGMMTRQEAAQFLACSLRTIDRLREDGKLRWRNIRRAVRILREDVERMAS